MLVPAHYPEASKIREIAVLPFDGPMGNEIASQIEGILTQANIEGRPFFTVVDRIKLKNIVEGEMRLSMSALVSEDTAVKVGRLVGAKGIYTGAVAASNTHDGQFTKKRTRCTEYKKREKRKWYQSEEVCVREEEYTVPCTKRTAVFAFTPKLIEVETGRIIYSQNISQTTESKACSDDPYDLKSPTQLINEAATSAMDIFRDAVIPYYITVAIRIMKPDDSIPSKEVVARVEQGIEFAENNRLDRACELWEEAKTLSQNSPSIFYNLGICAEVTGNPEQALDLYKKADHLLLKPDDMVNEALARVQKRIDDQRKLK